MSHSSTTVKAHSPYFSICLLISYPSVVVWVETVVVDADAVVETNTVVFYAKAVVVYSYPVVEAGTVFIEADDVAETTLCSILCHTLAHMSVVIVRAELGKC